jgi:hypothetical protein
MWWPSVSLMSLNGPVQQQRASATRRGEAMTCSNSRCRNAVRQSGQAVVVRQVVQAVDVAGAGQGQRDNVPIAATIQLDVAELAPVAIQQADAAERRITVISGKSTPARTPALPAAPGVGRQR